MATLSCKSNGRHSVPSAASIAFGAHCGAQHLALPVGDATMHGMDEGRDERKLEC